MSDNLFSKALESAVDEQELALPKGDIDVGEISSSSASEVSSANEESESSDQGDVDDDDDGEDVDDVDDEPNETGPIRSKHEIAEEPIIEISEDYKVKPDERICELGSIKSIYENNIIVAASMSGEQRVLRDGSVFCLEDRNVIGTLNEVFGPLQNPFYRICFNKEKTDIKELIEKNIGAKAYYVAPEAHWIDTFEIKRIKGTDASNGFDEELPDSEQEFSDDEKESQYKRMKKNSKKKKTKNQTNDSNNKIKKLRTQNNQNTNRNISNSDRNYPAMKLPSAMSVHGYKSRTSRESNDVPTENHREGQTTTTNSNTYASPPQPQPQNQNPYQNNTPALSYPQQQGLMQYPPFQQYPQYGNNMGYNNGGMGIPQPQSYPQQNMNINPSPIGQQQYSQQPMSNYNQYAYLPQGNMMQHQPPPPQQQNMDQVLQLHKLLLQQAQQLQQSQHTNNPDTTNNNKPY